jgi:hypothetical protein
VNTFRYKQSSSVISGHVSYWNEQEEQWVTYTWEGHRLEGRTAPTFWSPKVWTTTLAGQEVGIEVGPLEGQQKGCPVTLFSRLWYHTNPEGSVGRTHYTANRTILCYHNRIVCERGRQQEK